MRTFCEGAVGDDVFRVSVSSVEETFFGELRPPLRSSCPLRYSYQYGPNEAHASMMASWTLRVFPLPTPPCRRHQPNFAVLWQTRQQTVTPSHGATFTRAPSTASSRRLPVSGPTHTLASMVQVLAEKWLHVCFLDMKAEFHVALIHFYHFSSLGTISPLGNPAPPRFFFTFRRLCRQVPTRLWAPS